VAEHPWNIIESSVKLTPAATPEEDRTFTVGFQVEGIRTTFTVSVSSPLDPAEVKSAIEVEIAEKVAPDQKLIDAAVASLKRDIPDLKGVAEVEDA